MKLCSLEQYKVNIKKFKEQGKTTEEATALAYRILREDCGIPSDVGRLSPAEIVEFAENKIKKAFRLHEQFAGLEKLKDKDKWTPEDIELVLDAIAEGEETKVRLLFPETSWRDIANAAREWERGNSKLFLTLLSDYGYITEEALTDIYKMLQTQMDFMSLRKRQWKLEDVKRMIEMWRDGRRRAIIMLFPGLTEDDLNYAIGVWERDANPLISILAGYGFIQSKNLLGEALSRTGDLEIDLKYGHLIRCGRPFGSPISSGLPDASFLLFEQDETETEGVSEVTIVLSSELSEGQTEIWCDELKGLLGTYLRGAEPFISVGKTADGNIELTFQISNLLTKDVEVWEKVKEWILNKYLNGYVFDVRKDGVSTIEDWLGVEPKSEASVEHVVSVREMMQKLNEILEIE